MRYNIKLGKIFVFLIISLFIPSFIFANYNSAQLFDQIMNHELSSEEISEALYSGNLHSEHISDLPDALLVDIFKSSNPSRIRALVRNSNLQPEDFSRIIINLDEENVNKIFDEFDKSGDIINILSHNSKELFENEAILNYVENELNKGGLFLNNFVEPNVVNGYMKKKYGNYINFEGDPTYRITNYNKETGVIKLSSNTEFNLNVIDDAQVKENGCVESKNYGLYCGASILGDDGVFIIAGGESIIDNSNGKIKSFTLQRPSTVVLIDEISYMPFTVRDVSFEFKEDGLEIKGDFYRSQDVLERKQIGTARNQASTKNHMHLIKINGEIKENLNDKNNFKIIEDETEVVVFHQDALPQNKIVEFKLPSEMEFYTFDEASTNSRNINLGDFFDPCIQNKKDFCVSFNTENDITISHFDSNDDRLKKLLGIKTIEIKPSKGNYFSNPSFNYDLDEIYSMMNSYSLANSNNEMTDELKNQILQLYLDESQDYFGYYGEQIAEESLKRYLIDFPSIEGESEEEFYDRLSYFLERDFLAEFDFNVVRIREEINSYEELVLANKPHEQDLNSALLYLDDEEKNTIINTFETIIIDPINGNILTGYIDDEGNLRDPENNIIQENVDVDLFISSLLQGNKVVDFSSENQGIFSLERMINEGGNELLMNAVNNYIHEVNEDEGKNYPLFSKEDSEILSKLILGNADLTNSDTKISDVQEIFNKIPFYGELLGEGGIDGKLGPETSKTIAAYGQSLSSMVYADFHEDILIENKVSFANGINKKIDTRAFIFDVSGSVSPDLMSQQVNILNQIRDEGGCSENQCFYAYTSHTEEHISKRYDFDEYYQFLDDVGYQGQRSKINLEISDFGSELESITFAMNYLIENEYDADDQNKVHYFTATIHPEDTFSRKDNPESISKLTKDASEKNINAFASVLTREGVYYVDLSNPINEKDLKQYHHSSGRFDWEKFSLENGMPEESYFQNMAFSIHNEEYFDYLRRLGYYNQQRSQNDFVGIPELAP
jgi:hypothetical protein